MKANMKATIYYEITKNTDLMEGRGSMVGTGVCFKHEKDAITFCSSERYKGFAVMGMLSTYCRNNYKKVYAYPHESLEDYDNFDKQKALAEETADSIISKMSDVERQALQEALNNSVIQ